MKSYIPADQKIIFIEFHKWTLFWGLNINSEREINKVLKHYENQGFECMQYVPNMGFIPNIPFLKLIIVLLISTLTLGFVSYYVGPSFVFKRVGQPSLQNKEIKAPPPKQKFKISSKTDGYHEDDELAY